MGNFWFIFLFSENINRELGLAIRVVYLKAILQWKFYFLIYTTSRQMFHILKIRIKSFVTSSELWIKYWCLIYSNYCTLHNGTWFQSQHQSKKKFNPIPIYIFMRSLWWLLKRWQTTKYEAYYNSDVHNKNTSNKIICLLPIRSCNCLIEEGAIVEQKRQSLYSANNVRDF